MCVVLYRHAVCVGRVECAMYTLMDRCFWGPICYVLLWKNANTIGEQWVRSAVFCVGDRPKNSAEARKLVVIKLTFMQPIRSGDSTDNKCTKHVIQTQSTFSLIHIFFWSARILRKKDKQTQTLVREPSLFCRSPWWYKPKIANIKHRTNSTPSAHSSVLRHTFHVYLRRAFASFRLGLVHRIFHT